MKKVTMVDLRNGDVMIKFGENYAHIFYKGDVEDIENCIKDFEDDEDTSSWDNNEIEEWEEIYNSETTDLTNLEEIKEWNNQKLKFEEKKDMTTIYFLKTNGYNGIIYVDDEQNGIMFREFDNEAVLTNAIWDADIETIKQYYQTIIENGEAYSFSEMNTVDEFKFIKEEFENYDLFEIARF